MASQRTATSNENDDTNTMLLEAPTRLQQSLNIGLPYTAYTAADIGDERPYFTYQGPCLTVDRELEVQGKDRPKDCVLMEAEYKLQVKVRQLRYYRPNEDMAQAWRQAERNYYKIAMLVKLCTTRQCNHCV